MKRIFIRMFQLSLSCLVVMTLLLAACAPAQSTTASTTVSQSTTAPTMASQSTNAPTMASQPTVTTETQGRMTDQGTPRAETLIVDTLDGHIATPEQFNPFIPGTAYSSGFHQLCMGNLFENDGLTGKMIPFLAEKPAQAINPDFTKWGITLRKNMKWDDGVEITTDDIAFTMNLILTNKDIPDNAFWAPLVKDLKVVDKYNFEITLTKPYSRFDQVIGAGGWDGNFHIVPKHIWEGKDPTKFAAYPPVCSDAYKLNSVDTNGNWSLWERRVDWQNTPTGAVVGMPAPKYVLFEFYGPEEKRILAGIQHNLDVFVDITPDGWDVLRKNNAYAKAWTDYFPWANMDDPCERGMSVVDINPPFDKKEVRWALALATDIQSVSLATFSGKLRFAPLQIPPTSTLQPIYEFMMEDWLKNFALPDGYKPFDDTITPNFVKKLTDSGVADLPTDLQKQKETFGIGWWRYDPTEAAKLLESVGFKKGSDGMWLKPDGTPWKISINSPADFEPESGRLAFAVADSWKKFGIDTVAQAMDASTFWAGESQGSYDAGSYWEGCAFRPDAYNELWTWHKQFVVPIGQNASGNVNRFSNDDLSNLLDQLAPLTSEDPKIIDIITNINKIFVEEMPWIPMFGTSKFVPVDTYYFEGFPSAANHYNGPWWWWSNFRMILPKLKATGRQ